MRNKGYLLVLATAIISGFSVFLNKFGVSFSDPYIFTFSKNILVALLLTSVLLILKDYKILKSLKRKQWLILVAIGLIGGSVPFLLFFKGLSLTTASGASFIQKTMFIWIFGLAIFFLKEKISTRLMLAGSTLMLGNALLLKTFDIELDAGAVLIFVATIFWAIENVVSKHMLKELPAEIIMWSRMFFGSFFIFAFLMFNGQLNALGTLGYDQIVWIAITSILLFAYVATWYSGLKYIRVSEAAVILMLGSPITTCLNAMTTGAMSAKECFGILVAIIGVMVVIGADRFLAISSLNKFLIKN